MLPASGSRHGLAIVPEATFGVTPANPVFKKLRYNSTTLDLQVAALQSAEIREDRQIAGYRHGTRAAGGDIVSELSYGSLDDMIAYALMGAWAGDVLKVGLLRNSFTAERHYADVGQYLRFRGCEVNTMAMTVSPGAIVPLTFGIVSNDADPMVTTTVVGSTYTAPNSNNVMTGLEGGVVEGGAALGIVSEIQLSLNNNMNPTYVIGSAVSLQQSVGKSNVTGTVTVYFQDAVMYNKFRSETESSLRFDITDTDGNAYQFLLPRVVYGAAPTPVTSDGPITIAMTFQALYDATAGTNMQVTRVPFVAP